MPQAVFVSQSPNTAAIERVPVWVAARLRPARLPLGRRSARLLAANGCVTVRGVGAGAVPARFQLDALLEEGASQLHAYEAGPARLLPRLLDGQAETHEYGGWRNGREGTRLTPRATRHTPRAPTTPQPHSPATSQPVTPQRHSAITPRLRARSVAPSCTSAPADRARPTPPSARRRSCPTCAPPRLTCGAACRG